jgi:hypothetical protein
VKAKDANEEPDGRTLTPPPSEVPLPRKPRGEALLAVPTFVTSTPGSVRQALFDWIQDFEA